MASGYTCCIDLERLNNTIETLSSLGGCLETRDLPGIFIDMENRFKDINFEHNNCISDYKEEMDSIIRSLRIVEKKVLELEEALRKTVADYSNIDELKEEDLKDIAKLYVTEKEMNFMKRPIQISQSIDLYKENMDDMISDFMIENSLTDYPEEYSSMEEWAYSLEEKYKDLEYHDMIMAMDKEMATWRQERTGSTVASLATSDFADEQSNLNLWKKEYQVKYGATPEEAEHLAQLRIKYETNQDSALKRIDVIKQQLENTGKNIVKELESEPQTTVIPPPSPQETESHEINTVPIGLGIAAAGITGSIGAVIVSEQNRKKNFKLDEYKESYEEEYQPESISNTYDRKPEISDPVPYEALNRDKQKLNKFYEESYLFEEDSSNDKY